MTPTYRQDNAHFTYNNANPKNCKTAGDCVIRALALALNKDWDDVFIELSHIAFNAKRAMGDPKLYSLYLNSHGWTKYPQPRKTDNKKVQLKDFCKQCDPNRSYVVSLAGHLTCVKGGKIQDTWDCGDSTVGNYWSIGASGSGYKY
jgi:hypothetical protein